MKEKGIEERLNAAKGEAQIISEVDRILTESNLELNRSEMNILDQSKTLKSNKDKIELVIALSKAKTSTQGSFFAKSVVHLIKLANKTTDKQVLSDILNMLDNAVPFMGLESAAAKKAHMTLGVYAYGILTGKNAVKVNGSRAESLGDPNKVDKEMSTKAGRAAIIYTFGKELKGADLEAKINEFLKNCMRG